MFAAGLITWVGLLGWGWPMFDAAAMAVAVMVLALWGTLWVGRAAASRREPRRRPEEDSADRS